MKDTGYCQIGDYLEKGTPSTIRIGCIERSFGCEFGCRIGNGEVSEEVKVEYDKTLKEGWDTLAGLIRDGWEIADSSVNKGGDIMALRHEGGGFCYLRRD